jgi:hypothetical protein
MLGYLSLIDDRGTFVVALGFWAVIGIARATCSRLGARVKVSTQDIGKMEEPESKSCFMFILFIEKQRSARKIRLDVSNALEAPYKSRYPLHTFRTPTKASIISSTTLTPTRTSASLSSCGT